jgi:hypothetical protein
LASVLFQLTMETSLIFGMGHSSWEAVEPDPGEQS